MLIQKQLLEKLIELASDSVEYLNSGDHWITVHPHGKDNKGQPLLVKDGESNKDAINRKFGKKDKKESKETLADIYEGWRTSKAGSRNVDDYIGPTRKEDYKAVSWDNLSEITKGSEKQINWAVSIKHSLLNRTAKDFNFQIKKMPEEKKQFAIDKANEVLDYIKKIDDAKWLIDHRYQSTEFLLKEIIPNLK